MEANNMAAMREAIGDLLYMAELYVKKTPATESIIFDAKTKKEIRTINYYDVIAKAKSDLALPPRNCDVGTPEEQTKRHQQYCKWKQSSLSENRTCKGCPVYDVMMMYANEAKDADCDLIWAQMPYEEGGAE